MKNTVNYVNSHPCPRINLTKYFSLARGMKRTHERVSKPCIALVIAVRVSDAVDEIKYFRKVARLLMTHADYSIYQDGSLTQKGCLKDKLRIRSYYKIFHY